MKQRDEAKLRRVAARHVNQVEDNAPLAPVVRAAYPALSTLVDLWRACLTVSVKGGPHGNGAYLDREDYEVWSICDCGLVVLLTYPDVIKATYYWRELIRHGPAAVLPAIQHADHMTLALVPDQYWLSEQLLDTPRV